MLKSIFSIWCCCFMAIGLFAQRPKAFINQQSVGGFVQVGVPYYDLPEGIRYTPILTGLLYQIPFWESKSFFNASLGVAPHVGIAFFEKVDHEAGISVIISLNAQLGDNSMLSFRSASGPHYITVEMEEQINGFIFSDNFFFTYRHRFGAHNIGASMGWRHMSNAGLAKPNGGIDNYMFGLEFGLLID